MATKSFVRTRPGQRVDQPDFEHAVDQTPRDVLEQIGQHVLTGSDTSNPYVLEGFATTVVGTTITVTNGVALMNYRDRGVLRRGSVMSDGPTSRSIDIATYGGSPATTYNVYVCLTLEDSDFGNRPYWDNVGGVEETRNVATRRADNWSIAVETQSPGDEWMLIASVLKTGATVNTLTDLRQFYFEGSPAQTYQVTDNEWGTTDDRNNTRATYGVKSFRKFVRGVQRQIQSIIGTASPGGWWSAVPAGADLTSLLANKLARNGSQTMTGNLLPDADNTRDIGSTAARWANVISTLFRAHSSGSVIGRFRSVGNNSATLGGGRTPMLDGIMEGTTPGNEYRIIYQNDSSNIPQPVGILGPTIEIALNAEWYYDVGLSAFRWRSLNNSASSYLYVFSRTKGFQVYRKAATAAAWTDSDWTRSHEMSFDRLRCDVSDVELVSFVSITGTVSVQGTLGANSVGLTTNAPATPNLSTVYKNTVVCARGTVTANAGALTLGSSLSAGTNVAGAAVNGTNARVTFTTGFLGGDSYQVFLTSHGVAANYILHARASGYFDVRAYDTATGAALDFNTLTGTFDFVVIGG